MKKLALIGRDLSYSKSDVMHNFIFRELKEELVYDYFPVPEICGLKDTVFKLLNEYDGFNITIPYKESVIEYLNGIEKDAAVFNSVNTVICDSRKGYNTDGLGFMLMLRSEEIKVKDKKVLVLGSGGAAKSCIYKLCEAGGCVSVYNRTYSKAIELYNLYGGFTPLKKLDENQYDIIVNTTSVGMGANEGVLPISESYIEKAETLIDIIYKPEKTAFLQKGEKYGKKIVNGEKMLFFQAYYADMLYLDKKGDDKEALKLFKKYKEEQNK